MDEVLEFYQRAQVPHIFQDEAGPAGGYDDDGGAGGAGGGDAGNQWVKQVRAKTNYPGYYFYFDENDGYFRV